MHLSTASKGLVVVSDSALGNNNPAPVLSGGKTHECQRIAWLGFVWNPALKQINYEAPFVQETSL